MSAKVKISILIAAVVLVIAALVGGVFAVSQTSFKLEGNIIFKAKGIDATIELLKFENGTLNNGTVGTDKLNDITIESDDEDDDLTTKFASWSDLDLSFSDREFATPVVIQLKITNTAPSTADRFIDIDINLEGNDTATNCEITAVEDESNAQSTFIYPQEYKTFTITFSVGDYAEDAKIPAFKIDFSMNKVKAEDVHPSVETYKDTMLFTVDEATGTASVKGATGASGTIVIPEIVTYNRKFYSVTSVQDNAFANCTSITSITIPEGITSIGDSAFSGCTSLKTLSVPDSLLEIGDDMFEGCSNLEYTRTYPSAYNNFSCGNYIGNSNNPYVIFVSANDLYSTEEVTETSIENGTKHIANTAGQGFTSNLRQIKISDSVISIGKGAFQGLLQYSSARIVSVTLGANVKYIGDSAFSNCTGLTYIEIPTSVEYIGTLAFDGCTNLTQIRYRGTEEDWSKITVLSAKINSINVTYNFYE